MARRTSRPTSVTASLAPAAVQQVSGNPARVPGALVSSAAIYKPNRTPKPSEDRRVIATPKQIEAYRHLNICGEARYAVTLFAAMAARAEIGVSKPQSLSRKAVWVKSGPEVDAFAVLAPTVRERRKLIADYMTHYITAGECYLIARKRVDTDPGYIQPPINPDTDAPYASWDEALRDVIEVTDVLDEDFDPDNLPGDPNTPIWEIVAVTELRKINNTWEVRHDNDNFLPLSEDDPVIRLWNPDPENRREAWSPIMAMQSTLREIEWLTAHIFAQVKSRLMAAGVWFLPENLTFPPPPVDAVEGGADAIAEMNEAEQFMVSLAASAMTELDSTEISFPTIVMADPAALAMIDQKKLIQFWSQIDDKAMTLRDGAIRRFGLGMDLPSGMAVDTNALGTGNSSAAGSGTNHWGEWAKQEQAISTHVEPALDIFTGSLTASFLRTAVEGTELVLAYDTASLRLRQDRSKEAIELYDRGVLKPKVMVREVGFDPDNDMMDDKEFTRWLLIKIATGSATPEMVAAANALLGLDLPIPQPLPEAETTQTPGRALPPSLDDHPYEGPPREDHDHNPAAYSAVHASCEALVLRALEKAGNRLLNDGKRGRDKDRSTPPHMAHVLAPNTEIPEFDFSLAPTLLAGLPAKKQEFVTRGLNAFCADLYRQGAPYTREALMEGVKGL